uniref:Uncharacterized protein n=1 Tax=Siphoviridae sp. ctGDt6 TaxID=2825408 RepID=A0A8S5U830_9CAUD|nr:MAG TPA: hypothetical protein [Siphoviridae sp. ctGDt6]DAM20669.1 MAG TPA: hypothetical protein [Caudoviricetes sp.]
MSYLGISIVENFSLHRFCPIVIRHFYSYATLGR